MQVVPALDELKHRQARLNGRRGESFPLQQFTFQGSEEALAQGIIETIADRADRRTDAGFPAALGQRQA